MALNLYTARIVLNLPHYNKKSIWYVYLRVIGIVEAKHILEVTGAILCTLKCIPALAAYVCFSTDFTVFCVCHCTPVLSINLIALRSIVWHIRQDLAPDQSELISAKLCTKHGVIASII